MQNISLGAIFEPLVGTFGDNVRRLRQRARLNSAQLAETVGVTRPVVSKWEKNRTGLPETPTLFRIAKALRCTVEELLEGIDEEYDRIRRDLGRHDGDQESGLPPDAGGSYDATEAGVELSALRARLTQYEEAASQVLAITDQLYDAAVALEKMRAPGEREPRGGRSHRKTG